MCSHSYHNKAHSFHYQYIPHCLHFVITYGIILHTFVPPSPAKQFIVSNYSNSLSVPSLIDYSACFLNLGDTNTTCGIFKKELKVTKLMDCFLSCSTSHTNSIDQHTGTFKAVLPATGLFLNQFLWYISTTVFKKVIYVLFNIPFYCSLSHVSFPVFFGISR